MAKPKEQRWLDIPTAAEYMGVPGQTLRRLIRDGIVPHTKPGGRPKSRIYLDRQDLDALMAAGRREATQGPLIAGKRRPP